MRERAARVRQGRFSEALFDPDTVVAGLSGPDGAPPGSRLDVYRNNVVVGLTEALRAGFPAVAGAVGGRAFAALAAAFIRVHPPETPLLQLWGAALPVFLEAHAPLAAIPWLADLARLEQALREAYHAADGEPVAPERLAAIPPDRLPHLRLGLAPAARLVRSRWPIVAIRRFTFDGGEKPEAGGADVLVLRPEFDPEMHLLQPGEAAFLAEVMAGGTLGSALAPAGAGFDPGRLLGVLLKGGGIVGLT